MVQVDEQRIRGRTYTEAMEAIAEAYNSDNCHSRIHTTLSRACLLFCTKVEAAVYMKMDKSFIKNCSSYYMNQERLHENIDCTCKFSQRPQARN